MLFVHASLAICAFGVISNSCMILLLTQPRMRTTTNRLLASVTCADSLLMFSHLIYIIHFDLGPRNRCPIHLLTYGWVVFQLLHSNLSVYLRAFSLWISATMAGYRKTVLSRATPLRHEKRTLTLRMSVGVASAVLLVCTPIFLQNTVTQGPRAPENDSTCPRNHSPYYTLRHPKFVLWHDRLLLKVAYWINGLALKLLPCMVLTYYLIRVVFLMYKRHLKRQRSLFHNRPCPSGAGGGRAKKIGVSSNSGGGNPNVTMMPTSAILVTILLTTVLCEMPNAILSVMSGLLPHAFLRSTYVYLGEILDLLSLFSCTATSILYFTMSRSLRESFAKRFFIWRNPGAKMDTQSIFVSSARGRSSRDENVETAPLKFSSLW